MAETNSKSLPYLMVLTFISSIGGFLFGYSTSIISGTLPYLQNCWGGLPSQSIVFLALSATTWAIFGSITGGFLCDYYGRKTTILISAILFSLGAAISGSASGFNFILVGQALTGLAMGFTSSSVPLYLSELSPLKFRGAIVSAFQLMITMGILASYYIEYSFATEINPFSWRSMFLFTVWPALFFFTGMLVLPESPRFLWFKKRYDEAAKGLYRIEESSQFNQSVEKLSEINDNSNLTSSLRILKNTFFLTSLGFAITIMFFQQFVGINTIVYFAPRLINKLGFNTPDSILSVTLMLGIVNVVATLIFMFLIDKIGRRKFYFIGFLGMIAAMLLLGFSFIVNHQNSSLFNILSIIGIGSFVFFFAISIGPLAWLLISEVYPLQDRGKALGIGSAFNWLFNSIVTFMYLSFASHHYFASSLTTKSDFNPSYLFFGYAVVAAIGLFWGRKHIPETKGISLEELHEKAIK